MLDSISCVILVIVSEDNHLLDGIPSIYTDSGRRGINLKSDMYKFVFKKNLLYTLYVVIFRENLHIHCLLLLV